MCVSNSQKRIVALVTAATVLTGLVVYITFRTARPFLMPLTEASLAITPGSVDLGEVAVGGISEIVVGVRNHLGRPIELLEPETTCGCLAAELQTRVLKPRKETQMTLKFRAPLSPENFNRTVSLRSIENDVLVWSINVVGRSKAHAWATPSRINAQLDRDGVAHAQVTIHFDKPRTVTRAWSSRPELITLSPYEPSAQAQTYDVVLQSRQSGSAVIRFCCDHESKALVEVPVAFSAFSPLRCVPDRLVLKSSNNSHRREAQLVVVRADGFEQATLDVTPLVPWVSVHPGYDKTAKASMIDVSIDETARPEARFKGKVLRCSLSEFDASYDVEASFIESTKD